MTIHPEVSRVLKPQATVISIKTWSENPRSARGFYPPNKFPNFKIEYKQSKETHSGSVGKRTVNVQFGGDHIGGRTDIANYAAENGSIIVSCLSINQAGRLTSVLLNHIARNGGRLSGSFYFTWQGQMVSGRGEPITLFPILFKKLKDAFGVSNLRLPNEKDDVDLYNDAGIDVAVVNEKLPKIIDGKKELLPATKILMASGVDLDNVNQDILSVPKIPVDINHQNTLRKALDDLKDAGILDYDIKYDKGKIVGIDIMLSGIDSNKNGATLESMKTIKDPVVYSRRFTSCIGSFDEMTHKGISFGISRGSDDGMIVVVEGKSLILVATFEDRNKENLNKMIREAANRIKEVGINEAANLHWKKPLCG